MADVVQLEPKRFGEKPIIHLINRYSSLRAAERALRPSVRARRSLPTAELGRDLVTTLQDHLERVRALAVSEHLAGAHESDVVFDLGTSLQAIEAELEEFAVRLGGIIKSTPLPQLRSTLPIVAKRYRAEASALLDLCIEVTDFESEPPFLVDYLVTMLSSSSIAGHRAIRCDPARVTPGVARRCAEYEKLFSHEAAERASLTARRLRNATMEVLVLDELEGLVLRMRDLKREVGVSFFDRDVLRSVVHYNVSVGNRFQTLFDLERERDVAAERTLAALQALDEAPLVGLRKKGPPDTSFASVGLRALEDALRQRLRGAESEPGAAIDVASKVDLEQLSPPEVQAFVEDRGDSSSKMLRAAVVVGLALRELPILSVQLKQLDIDTDQLKTSWVTELDAVLMSAIQSLQRAGQHDEAAQLTHTRMKFLSAA